MAEDKNKNDRTAANEEALLIRPSGAPPLTSLDQLSTYNNYYNPGVSMEGFSVRDLAQDPQAKMADSGSGVYRNDGCDNQVVPQQVVVHRRPRFDQQG
ncbi:MAG: hypothetical protein IPL01_24295 [Acidobacteria bacterium]|nr:hypothetical protein [Acidobacteriota bacterium]